MTTKYVFLWVCCGLALIASASAQEVLPRPEEPFGGKIGLTYKDSTPVKPELKVPETFGLKDAPNILIVLLDDVGYGQMGTFGGAIPTPTMDRVANNGLRYTRFHTTALCSPTRAVSADRTQSALGGHGRDRRGGDGVPGLYRNHPVDAATFAEILREYGYANAWFGKNHNVPDWETSLVGPFDRWADGLGFDYFYGFVGGDTDQFHPAPSREQETNRTAGNERGRIAVSPDHRPSRSCHSDDSRTQAVAPQRPFFVYFSTGATHAPHQVPRRMD